MWCIPHVDGEYVARMEDVLDLYAETPDPARPLVCFDKTPVQLDRRGAPAGPGPTGTARALRLTSIAATATVNLFDPTFDPHRGWRNVKLTDRRAAVDYATACVSSSTSLSRRRLQSIVAGQSVDP